MCEDEIKTIMSENLKNKITIINNYIIVIIRALYPNGQWRNVWIWMQHVYTAGWYVMGENCIERGGGRKGSGARLQCGRDAPQRRPRGVLRDEAKPWYKVFIARRPLYMLRSAVLYMLNHSYKFKRTNLMLVNFFNIFQIFFIL